MHLFIPSNPSSCRLSDLSLTEKMILFYPPSYRVCGGLQCVQMSAHFQYFSRRALLLWFFGHAGFIISNINVKQTCHQKCISINIPAYGNKAVMSSHEYGHKENVYLCWNSVLKLPKNLHIIIPARLWFLFYESLKYWCLGHSEPVVYTVSLLKLSLNVWHE